VRAFILAAGSGERLRPMTDAKPKPMIEIAGRPILEHNVLLCAHYGVRNIFINTHHRSESIVRHFGDGARFGVTIEYSHEPELLGTAGALVPMRDRLTETFFVAYGDNLTNCSLDRLLTQHHSSGAMATIALFYREDASASGVVEIDDRDRVTRFIEKPPASEIRSPWVSAGIIVCEPAILASIPEREPSDFGRDIFPALLERGETIGGYRMSESLFWIDTMADLERTASVATPGMFPYEPTEPDGATETFKCKA
jgi:NDP-sugar pyrophosphorylase family protein